MIGDLFRFRSSGLLILGSVLCSVRSSVVAGVRDDVLSVLSSCAIEARLVAAVAAGDCLRLLTTPVWSRGG